MPIECFACSVANPDGNRFCGTCGASLPAIPPAERAPRPLEEIKQVTVLFADVVGSTELVARLDPEEAMDRLRPALATMRESVRRFDGTVAQTLGDGVMALFGAPRAQEGHALLACEAALAMQRAFPSGAGGVRIRVGLHSGAVVASAPLHGAPVESAAHGVTVHVASRLQAMAAPSSIYLTEDCCRLVQPYCRVLPLGRQPVRGIAGGIEVYQLLGLKPAVANRRFRGAALAPFLGRGHEMDALRRALQAAGEGEASAIGIAGSPGTGKSRLCHEFSKWCRSRLVPVFEARAHPYGRAAPLQPVLEFFRLSLFKLRPSDSPARARQRIASRLAGLEPGSADDLPRLFEFLGIADGDAPASSLARLTPMAQREWLLDLVRWMVRWFGRSPWLLVVEDLHWLDEASEEFIGALVSAVPGTRTLLLLNYRPAYAAPWMRHPWFKAMTLAELPAPATAALVEQLVGRDPRLARLRRRVVERSGGNPFFAEELVRSLVEEGARTGRPGQRTPGPEVGDKLPTTVQAVIGARIDRLGASARTILQICAVIGQETPHTVLEQVSGTPHGELDRDLDQLAAAGLLQPLPTSNGPRSGFRHPMIQEVAYATQLKARRDKLHAAVAAALNDHYASRLDEFSALLSHHHELAGQSYEAAQHAARAARWAGSKSPALAIRHWQKVRGLLRTQLASRDEDALRIMASAQIAWLGWREGLSAERDGPFIQEALSWAREADDSMVPLLLFVEGRVAGAGGGTADAYVERVRDALAMLRPGPDDGRAATLYVALSQAYGWAGLQREALAASDAALARVAATERFDHDFLGYSVERWAKSLRSRILTRLGRFDEAQACLASMDGPEFAAEDPTVRFIPHLAAADMAWFHGDGKAAAHHAERVVEIASANNSAYLRVYAHEAVGLAKAMQGDHAGAARECQDALDIVRATRVAKEVEADLLARIAEAHLGLGERETAEALAREGLEIAESRTARMSKCRLCIVLARACRASPDPGRNEEAAWLLREAEALIQLTGARLYENALASARAAVSSGPNLQPGGLAVPKG